MGSGELQTQKVTNDDKKVKIGKPRTRPVPHAILYPPLSEEMILEWADAHHARTGGWPTQQSGVIVGGQGATWTAVNQALGKGSRSLPGGSSLAQLLAAQRGSRNIGALPNCTEEQILRWCDQYRARHGKWPNRDAGPVEDAPGEEWAAICAILKIGGRGLERKISLSVLLHGARGVRSVHLLPGLTVEGILQWADAHHAQTGAWPTEDCVALGEMEDRWDTISSALRAGCRTLPGGSSLAKLLAADRGVRNRSEHPRYNEEMILEWCDGFHARHGTWPKATSGAVEDAPGETWAAVVAALSGASRGITRKLSLANLLQERRDVRNVQNQPRLIIDNILQWADAFHARTGRWPTEDSGEIPEAPGETWGRVSNAIYIGTRGLTFGATLARILATQRDHVLYTKKAPHTHEQILAWADEYRARTGKWPNAKSGPVEGAAGENWNAVNTALQMGIRGHPGGDSLARLFQRERRE